MAASTTKPKKKIATKTRLSFKSKFGAPSQYVQPSRKGKKAWRKNVDNDKIEEGLEELRAEEREVGSSLHKKPDEELFRMDDKGDDKIRPHLPKFDRASLSYARALAQRSAIPAVFSRVTASSRSKQIKLGKEDKERMLRIARRPRAGPFNSIVLPDKNDPESLGAAARSHAVQESGRYDIWAATSEAVPEDKDADAWASKNSTAIATAIRTTSSKVHHPKNALRDAIALPAVLVPPSGASYNPPADAHAALLQEACVRAEREEVERVRKEEARREAERVRRAHVVAENVAGAEGGVPGMAIDTGENVEGDGEEKEKEGENDGGAMTGKGTMPARKTKQQRRKKERLLAEKRALAERLAHKRLLASTSLARSIARETDRTLRQHAQAREARRTKLVARLHSSGLAGKKLGKHIIAGGEVDVQLGEDLSESLRGLKVEGNLFRDRFLSMQHRALIEPRALVLPKKGRRKTKEVEKHSWKYFDMEQEFPL